MKKRGVGRRQILAALLALLAGSAGADSEEFGAQMRRLEQQSAAAEERTQLAMQELYEHKYKTKESAELASEPTAGTRASEIMLERMLEGEKAINAARASLEELEKQTAEAKATIAEIAGEKAERERKKAEKEGK